METPSFEKYGTRDVCINFKKFADSSNVNLWGALVGLLSMSYLQYLPHSWANAGVQNFAMWF